MNTSPSIGLTGADGPEPKNWWSSLVFAVVMALSRVYLRAHWLSDVAAGAALGAAIAIGAATLMHWLDERREARFSDAATESTDGSSPS